MNKTLSSPVSTVVVTPAQAEPMASVHNSIAGLGRDAPASSSQPQAALGSRDTFAKHAPNIQPLPPATPRARPLPLLQAVLIRNMGEKAFDARITALKAKVPFRTWPDSAHVETAKQWYRQARDSGQLASLRDED